MSDLDSKIFFKFTKRDMSVVLTKKEFEKIISDYFVEKYNIRLVKLKYRNDCIKVFFSETDYVNLYYDSTMQKVFGDYFGETPRSYFSIKRTLFRKFRISWIKYVES